MKARPWASAVLRVAALDLPRIPWTRPDDQEGARRRGERLRIQCDVIDELRGDRDDRNRVEAATPALRTTNSFTWSSRTFP